ncbi:type IV secretory system conjugative DNA transfer family protein [Maritalea sp.]|uniref:type IV secretory system conjugative DNA transfer family protein n=1 Tax=Maritalea sp. TaxID=2003361 RepID=UPI003EF25E0F
MKKLLKSILGVTPKNITKIKRQNREIRRIIGLSKESGKPIFEPNTTTSWLILGGAGSGKSTAVTVPAIQSLLRDHSRGQWINDVKAEIAPQIASMCIKHGRKFAIIDPTNQLGKDYPHTVHVNPLDHLVEAYKRKDTNILSMVESFANIVIPEPENDPKNKYFRTVPREIGELAALLILENQADNLTLGGIAALISDPETFNMAVDAACHDGNQFTKARARQIQELRDNDPEHYSQHKLAILSSLRLFQEGSALHEVGYASDITVKKLLKENYIVCVVGSVAHAQQQGAYYGLVFNAVLHNQLTGKCGRTILIFDEAAATPCKEIIEKVIVFRSFGLQVLYIAQSLADLQRQYGAKTIATLEDNTFQQILKVGNYEAADRLSKAIGDVDNVGYSLNEQGGKLNLSRTINIGRERKFSADQLINLPASEQIINVGKGYIHTDKCFQNYIFPHAQELDVNPVEQGVLPPICKVTLPTTPWGQS